MSARPILGMICCRRSVGTEHAQAVMERYLYGVAPHVDAIPLLVPSLPRLVDAERVADRMEGLLLTGSPSNLQPHIYGHQMDDAPGPFDADRDSMALALADAMLKRGKPVFGICRGFQELNVHFGGTLARDLAAPDRTIRHHAPDDVGFNDMFSHAHPVSLTQDGVLHKALGRSDLVVNSVHYQGIDRLGEGLQVEAIAPDGVVEAFSSHQSGAPVLAVQWHPEWQPQSNPDSLALFALMGRLLRGQAE